MELSATRCVRVRGFEIGSLYRNLSGIDSAGITEFKPIQDPADEEAKSHSTIIFHLNFFRLYLHESKLAFKPSFKPTKVHAAIVIIYFGLKRFLSILQTSL